MAFWISSLGGNQCVITKRKYGTEASVLPSSKRELGRGKKKKILNCPPNLRKSVESVECI